MARDAPIPPRGFPLVGTAALLALIALVVSLDHWVAFDATIWRAVLLARGCRTDGVVESSMLLATRGLAVLFVCAVVLHVRASGLRSAWPWVGTWLLGLLTSKTLKHLLTRERPSMLPDLAVGYSFPSAHVLNGVLAMIVVMALARGFRHRGRWYVLAGALTSTVASGRILLGRHWATDVLGGVLVALVLVGFVVPALVRRPILAAVLLAAAMGGTFALDRHLGPGRLRLPSPLVARRSALVDVDVGPETRSALGGTWPDAGLERPFGSYLWLEGAGSVTLVVPATAVEGGVDLQLAFAGRPQKTPRSCTAVAVTLNGRELGRFVAFVGWREYRLRLPVGLVHAGANEVGFTAGAGERPARFGITYVRLAPERSAAD